MFCPQCGTNNEDGAVFCGHCGTSLTQTAAAQTAVNAAPAAAPTQTQVVQTAQPVQQIGAIPTAQPVQAGAQMPAYQPVAQTNSLTNSLSNSKIVSGIIAIIAAALLLLQTAGWIGIRLSSSNSGLTDLTISPGDWTAITNIIGNFGGTANSLMGSYASNAYSSFISMLTGSWFDGILTFGTMVLLTASILCFFFDSKFRLVSLVVPIIAFGLGIFLAISKITLIGQMNSLAMASQSSDAIMTGDLIYATPWLWIYLILCIVGVLICVFSLITSNKKA